MSTYSDRVAADEGALHEEREAVGRLKDLAAEYAGTELGAMYARQYAEAIAPQPQPGAAPCPHCGQPGAVLLRSKDGGIRCLSCDDGDPETTDLRIDALLDY